MLSDRLFEAALSYKKSKLWERLYDSQIFAVKHFDDTVSYCCVMGRVGELYALAAYHGQAGLDSLHDLHNLNPDDMLITGELMRGQDCLMVSFESKAALLPRALQFAKDYCARTGTQLRGKNAFPSFERFRPGFERWYLEDETDQRYLAEALEAATEVADRLRRDRVKPEALGLMEDALSQKEMVLLSRSDAGYVWSSCPTPHRSPVVYPEMRVEDDMTRVRLSKARLRGDWAARVFLTPTPVAEGTEDNESDLVIPFDALDTPPFYPYALMVVNARSGMILMMHLTRGPEYGPEFAEKIAEICDKDGLPRRMLVEDDRSEAMFRPFCEQFGIQLLRCDSIEALDDALDSFLESFDMDDLDDEDDDVDDGEIDAMLDLLRDEALVREIPTHMLREMFREIDMSQLPGDVADNLKREAKRRGIRI